jgi:hypothetical protein
MNPLHTYIHIYTYVYIFVYIGWTGSRPKFAIIQSLKIEYASTYILYIYIYIYIYTYTNVYMYIHLKAGRVVGQKGAMIQSLKIKSGAMQIRMQKDPKVHICDDVSSRKFYRDTTTKNHRFIRITVSLSNGFT